MQILLKSLLKEVEDATPLQIQIYVDMDGVLADMETGFKKISGGYTSDDFKNSPQCRGDKRISQKLFWKLIGRTPNFWLNLPVLPDAKILWKYVKENFTNPAPVILSAGQGGSLIAEKTQWAHIHIDPNVKVIVAHSKDKKVEYMIKYPPEQRVTHVLIDDRQKNIDLWDNTDEHRVGILHTDAANTIKQLAQFVTKK
jgi:hypothetical protein